MYHLSKIPSHQTISDFKKKNPAQFAMPKDNSLIKMCITIFGSMLILLFRFPSQFMY